MNILVTGCAGFIGSVVTEKLLDKGYTVIGIDNLSHGFIESIDSRAIFHKIDIMDIASLEYIFTQYKIDCVCHLAAEAVIVESMTDPKKFLDTNVVGGTNILEVMLKYGCNKFIMSSTASTYGEPIYTPMDELHPQNPANFYGESKLIFERILNWYKANKGLEFIAFRYFNVGGATEKHGERRTNETRLVPAAIRAAYDQTIFSVYGNDYNTKDGTPERDYVHVSDVADAHIIAIEKIGTTPHSYYNLGGETAYSVMDFLTEVEKFTERKITYTYADRRPGDVEIYWANSKLAKDELSWNADKSTLQDIVKDSVVWYKSLFGV
jgi:UDP-glucose 4-epimerase